MRKRLSTPYFSRVVRLKHTTLYAKNPTYNNDNIMTTRLLTPLEEQQLLAYRQLGDRIVHHYRPQLTRASASDLDAIFKDWHASDIAKPSALEISYGLGVLFGDLLVSDQNAAWRMESDAKGIDFCLALTNGSLLFPFSYVHQRLPDASQKADAIFSAAYALGAASTAHAH